MFITKDGICNMFTEKVEEMIKSGCCIYPYSMSGTQGEIAKIDFVSKNDVFRILLEENLGREFGKTITLKVVKYVNGKGYTGVFWNNKGEIIYKKEFYCVSDRSNIWVDDVETLKHILEVRRNRMRPIERVMDTTAYRDINITAPIINKLYHMIKTSKGYSGIRKSDIKCVKRCGNSYVVYMNANACRTYWEKSLMSVR